MAKKQSKAAPEQNPLVGTDAGETIESVHNVLEFMAWHKPEGGEVTTQMEDGRRLILQACTNALQIALEEVRHHG
jgi:hypothetical protein